MVPRLRSMHRYKVEQDRCQRSRSGTEPGVSGHGSQSWSQGPRPLLLTCLSGCHVNTLDAGRLACPLQLSTAWSGTDLSVACPKAAAGNQQSVFRAMYKHRFLLTVTAPETGRGRCWETRMRQAGAGWWQVLMAKFKLLNYSKSCGFCWGFYVRV